VRLKIALGIELAAFFVVAASALAEWGVGDGFEGYETTSVLLYASLLVSGAGWWVMGGWGLAVGCGIQVFRAVVLGVGLIVLLAAFGETVACFDAQCDGDDLADWDVVAAILIGSFVVVAVTPLVSATALWLTHRAR
jgi:hypothetical protein